MRIDDHAKPGRRAHAMRRENPVRNGDPASPTEITFGAVSVRNEAG